MPPEQVSFDAESWNSRLIEFPDTPFLQTWEWAQVKAQVGWKAFPLMWPGVGGKPEAAALVLQRSFSLAGLQTGLRILYVPRGPLLDWSNQELRQQVLADLLTFARQQRAIFLKIDPALPVGTGVPGQPDACDDPTGQSVQAELEAAGWKPSQEQIQFRNTVLIPLNGSEEELLARMKQKTRYNIRLAERKGVQVRPGSEADFPEMYRLYAETSVRDGFVIRDEAYYRHVWTLFTRAGMGEPLIAEVEGEPVAAIFLIRFGHTVSYVYGMSSTQHREKMPNYLLQWEAIRLSAQAGFQWYDLWGAPDKFDESDSMWGVFRFKEGLGGQVVRTLGAWDFPIRPGSFQLYTQTLPHLLDWMRRRGREKTRQQIT